jgi:hypothetical protein
MSTQQQTQRRKKRGERNQVPSQPQQVDEERSPVYNETVLAASFSTIALHFRFKGITAKEMLGCIELLTKYRAEEQKEMTIKAAKSIAKELKKLWKNDYTLESLKGAIEQSREKDKSIALQAAEFLREEKITCAFFDNDAQTFIGSRSEKFIEFKEQIEAINDDMFIQKEEDAAEIVQYVASLFKSKDDAPDFMKTFMASPSKMIGALANLNVKFTAENERVLSKTSSNKHYKTKKHFVSKIVYSDVGAKVDTVEAVVALNTVMPYFWPEMDDSVVIPVEMDSEKNIREGDYFTPVLDNISLLLTVSKKDGYGSLEQTYLDPLIIQETFKPTKQRDTELRARSIYTGIETLRDIPTYYEESLKTRFMAMKWTSKITVDELLVGNIIGRTDILTVENLLATAKKQKAENKEELDIDTIFENYFFFVIDGPSALVLAVPNTYIDEETALWDDCPVEGIYPLTRANTKIAAYAATFTLNVKLYSLLRGRREPSENDYLEAWDKIPRRARMNPSSTVMEFAKTFLNGEFSQERHRIVRAAAAVKDEQVLNFAETRWATKTRTRTRRQDRGDDSEVVTYRKVSRKRRRNRDPNISLVETSKDEVVQDVPVEDPDGEPRIEVLGDSDDDDDQDPEGGGSSSTDTSESSSVDDYY